MTQEDLDAIIHCEKIITVNPKKKFYTDRRGLHIKRNDFSCESVDGQYKFKVFMRINDLIANGFSIGLVWKSENKEINLVRFNGAHVHKNKDIDNKIFNTFHIHIANIIQLNKGLCNKFDAIEGTYISYESALAEFLNFCNIKDESDVLRMKGVRYQFNFFEFKEE